MLHKGIGPKIVTNIVVKNSVLIPTAINS
jgi:hypothetical protein